MVKVEGKGKQGAGQAKAGVPVDPYRAHVFPNRMREQRRRLGYPKLLRLSAEIPEIPYVRLSKIERGEVVARPDELRRIGAALGIAATDLLLDIDAPGFDIADWARPFSEGELVDLEEERFAVLLGAALRARRTSDPTLTIAAVERDFGLPPVNLSRIENAQKPFGRWNAATRQALYRLFDVAGEHALRALVEARHAQGVLEPFLSGIADPAMRHARSSARIAELAQAIRSDTPLERAAPAVPPPPAVADVAPQAPTVPLLPVSSATLRMVPVRGAPLPNGLIADSATDDQVEAPTAAGPRSFGLKVCRATLGAGLPAQATVIADPDRFPAPGGLVALREAEGWRLLSVGSSRDGRMIGYSSNPDIEVPLDDCDPARLAAVVGASFL
ncbi:helix-turn-helix domain-containing protein [Sphingomonas sp. CJ20]